MAQTVRRSVVDASADTISYLSGLSSIADLTTLQTKLGEITRAIGFDVYVLGQLPQTGHAQSDFRITTYPQLWIDEAYAQFRYKADPVLDALLDADAPFLWEDLPAYTTPTRVQAAYIEVSERYGYLRGYTVPIRIPGEPIGVASFATRNNGPVPLDMLPFVQQIAVSSFNRARAIVALERGRRRSSYGLTAVETACLRAAAQGKSNFIIGRVLGISEGAVRQELKSVQKKLGTGNRTSMAVKAIQVGFINFTEALIE